VNYSFNQRLKACSGLHSLLSTIFISHGGETKSSQLFVSRSIKKK